MLLQDYLNVDELAENLHNGYIMQKEHPEYPLSLLCYTRKAQYDGWWPESVSKSRGLIIEQGTGIIIGFCMPKFHNKSEHDNGKVYAKPLPVYEDFTVFDKMDGSMGTVYYYAGLWHVATKGSFVSEQSEKATELVRSKPTEYLIPEMTYVTEIIYPNNRIVVDYGDRTDLVLLTSYLPSGEEVLHPESWKFTGFSYVPYINSLEKSLHNLTYEKLDDLTFEHIIDSGTEAEGYVVRFESGLRVKLKFPEYLALHKILTNCTERTIWEALYNETSLDQFFENVPDEFDNWAKSVMERLSFEAWEYEMAAGDEFLRIIKLTGAVDRKRFAMEALKSPYKAALFRLLDGKSIRDIIWKSVYPKNEKPFKAED